jgi:hypothetical protein
MGRNAGSVDREMSVLILHALRPARQKAVADGRMLQLFSRHRSWANELTWKITATKPLCDHKNALPEH